MEEQEGNTGYQNLETQPLIPKEKKGEEPQATYPSLTSEQQRQEQPNQRQSESKADWKLLFSPKGILRLLQIALALISLILLRAKGGSLWIVMSDINVVYLSIGVLITFLIITPSLLASNVCSGGSSSSAPLEMVVSVVGCVLFFVSGIMIINTWRDVNAATGGQFTLNDIPSLVNSITSVSISGAMQSISKEMVAAGSLSLINGVVYAAEVVYTYTHYKKTSAYTNPS